MLRRLIGPGIVLWVLIFAKPGYAELDFEDGAFAEFVTSARALAMGNAFIAKVDGPWAAFYNPAGLGTIRNTQMHLLNIHAEVNKGYVDLAGSDGATSTLGNAFDLRKAEGTRQLVTRPGNENTLSHSRINLFPNFTTRYFQLGYLYSKRSRGRYQGTGSDFEWAERRDHGPVAAFNFSLWGGIFKFGTSATYLMRREVQQDYDATAPVNISDQDYQKGRGLIFTTGAKLTLPVAWLPTFAFVSRNTGARNFGPVNDTNPIATRVEQSYDAGFSLTPQMGKFLRMHMEVNWKDITNKYDTDIRRRLGLGMEFDYKRSIFVRFGYGDGWGSAGVGIRSQKLIVDLTTYAIESSTNPSAFREQEDRRMVLSLSSGF